LFQKERIQSANVRCARSNSVAQDGFDRLKPLGTWNDCVFDLPCVSCRGSRDKKDVIADIRPAEKTQFPQERIEDEQTNEV
jgi:hypothetical protein